MRSSLWLPQAFYEILRKEEITWTVTGKETRLPQSILRESTPPLFLYQAGNLTLGVCFPLYIMYIIVPTVQGCYKVIQKKVPTVQELLCDLDLLNVPLKLRKLQTRFFPDYRPLTSIFLELYFRKLAIVKSFSFPVRYKSSSCLLPVLKPRNVTLNDLGVIS